MELIHAVGLLAVLGLVFVTAFYEFSAITWTIAIGAALILTTIVNALPMWFEVVAWLVFIPAALYANLSLLRQQVIIPLFLKTLQKKLPPISQTEREAIQAGNTWWEKELFSGKPDWSQLFSYPKPMLNEEEQHFLDHEVEHLCGMLNDWQIVNEMRNMPQEVWDYLKKERFFGMVIPKEYGGRGFSALGHSTVVTKIATRSISAAVNTMVPNSLGPAELLTHYGTDEQKTYYLPRLARGEEIPCFALTAPEAGSDAGAIPDTGIVCKGRYQGKEITGIRLNWDKRYITLAPIATVLGLAFKLYDPEHLLGDQEDIGITLCLLPTSHPGVEIGTRHYPLQLAFMNGPTRGKDVFIPMDWIIGGQAMAGQGWRMLMECLSIGRSISLPALATASAKLTYRNTGAYARLRRQFNTPLSSFEGIEEALSYIAGFTYMLEATRVMTASAVDMGMRPSTASAIAKYHMTELSRQVVSHAMDIHAGQTIQVGPRNFLANIHFSTPISITVEGANILTRNLIIFGQGAIRCHAHLLKEIEIISAPNPNIQALDNVMQAHIGSYISTLIRTVAYGLTGGKLISSTVKNTKIAKLQKQLTRMSCALALLADTSLILLGGSLKRRERISARLGDMLSNLYLASAILKYYNDNGCQKEDVDYVTWSLQYCLQRMQLASRELCDNYPKRWLGKLLGWFVFPFGSAYAMPSDKNSHQIVASMLAPSDIRDRLTKYCYNSTEHDDTGRRLDQALTQVNIADPIWKKIVKAVQVGVVPAHYDKEKRIAAAKSAGILDADESSLLHEFEALRDEIIKVNEFSFDLSKVIT